MQPPSLPPIFCPHCATLLTEVPACSGCGWQRPFSGGEPGNLLWETQLPGRSGEPYNQPAATATHYFVPVEEGHQYETRQGSIYALEAATGAVAWQHRLEENRISRVLVVTPQNDLLLVATEDTNPLPASQTRLLALETVTGQVRWECPIPASSLSAPAILDDLLFCTSNNRAGYGVALISGEIVWEINGLPSWSPAPPAAGDGQFFFGSYASQITAVSRDGQIRPLFSLPDDSYWFSLPLAYADGLLYAACRNRQLYVLDGASGQLRWQISGGRGITAAPAIGPHVYLGIKDAVKAKTYNLVACRRENGAAVWSFAQNTRYFSAQPRLAENCLLAANEDGRLFALDAVTGELLWQHPHEAGQLPKILSVPAVAGNSVGVLAKSGLFQAIVWRQANYLEQLPDPAELAAAGQWAQAGHILVLQERYAEAASLYQQADLPYHAAQLYEKVADWNAAGRLYLTADEQAYPQTRQKAVTAFQQGGDQAGEAAARLAAQQYKEAGELFELLGQPGAAAAAFEQAGLLGQAAICFAQDQQPEKAIKIYLALKEPEPAAALYQKMGQVDEAVAVLQQFRRYQEAANLLVPIGRIAEAATLLEEAGNVESAAQVWLQHNKPDEAAAIYERAGQWEKAGDSLANHQPELAIQHYLQAKRLEKAAQLYVRLGQYGPAVTLYEKLGDMRQMASAAEQAGQWQEAATAYLALREPEPAAAVRCYRQGGHFAQAATLLASLGQLDEAVHAWRQAHQPDQAVALLKKAGQPAKTARLLEDLSRYAEAAQIWLEQNEIDEAARLYRLADQPQKALDLYEKAGNWRAVRQIAGEMNDFEREAHACLQLAVTHDYELFHAAAQAFERAAQAYEAHGQKTGAEIARLWELAAHHYTDWDPDRLAFCQQQVIRLRRWPDLRVEVNVAGELVKDEWRKLSVKVTNIGHGLARFVSLRVTNDSFEMDQKRTSRLPNLRVGANREIELTIKPREAGMVPIHFELSYQLPDETEFRRAITDSAVPVRASASQQFTPTPAWLSQLESGGGIHIYNILKEGTTIHSGSSSQVFGDVVLGDKGDKVEIRREGGRSLSLRSDSVEIGPDLAACQHHYGTDGQGQFCQKCGQPRSEPSA